jgi:hypothetical protein
MIEMTYPGHVFCSRCGRGSWTAVQCEVCRNLFCFKCMPTHSTVCNDCDARERARNCADKISSERSCINCSVRLVGEGSIYALCDNCLALLGEDEQALYRLAQKRFPRMDREIAPELIRLFADRKDGPATGLLDFVFYANVRLGDRSKLEENLVSISQTEMKITRNEPVYIPLRDMTSIDAGSKKGQLFITTCNAPNTIELRLTDAFLEPEIITRRLVLHVKSNAVKDMKTP